MKLILRLRCLLKCLIVVNAEDTLRQVGIEEQPAAFGREVTRPRVPGDIEGRKTFVVGEVNARRYAVNLRQLPRNREGDWRIQQHAEIVGVACAFPEIVGVNHDVLADALLNANIELMTASRLQRLSSRLAQTAAGQSAPASRARKDQVLVVRRLQTPAVGGAQDSIGRFEMIRKAQARLPQMVFADAGVIVETHARAERQVAQRDRILSVDRRLFDVSMAVESEQASAARQIKWQQT